MSSPLQEIIKAAQEIQGDLDTLIFPGLGGKTVADMYLYPGEKNRIRKVRRNDIFSGGLEIRWVNVDLLGAIVPYRDIEDEGKDETIEMLSSTCIDLMLIVQRQKKQLQKQRKQLTDARDQMIKLQTYADTLRANNVELRDSARRQLDSRRGGISDMEALD